MRTTCGFGSMDDDEHVLACVTCNLARWSEYRRDHPGRLRRAARKVIRFVAQGDPLLLPPKDHPAESDVPR